MPLDPGPAPFERLAALLEPHERDHAARLATGGDAWAAARGALRLILSHHLQRPAESLRFREAAGGKPELADGSSLRFNLSHAAGLALVALASDRAVGVDVERMTDRTDIEALTRDVLTGTDAAAVRATPPGRRRAAFFAAWTRHEARLKLSGTGLAGRKRSVPRDPVALVVVRGLAVRPGFAAAVAAEGGSWTVRLREFREAL